MTTRLRSAAASMKSRRELVRVRPCLVTKTIMGEINIILLAILAFVVAKWDAPVCVKLIILVPMITSATLCLYLFLIPRIALPD